MTLALGLALAGGLGAITRFLLDGMVSARTGGGFPAGTFMVNISGACMLGLVVGASLDGDALALVGTGALGSYTTFSTWMLESHRLAEDGAYHAAALNVAASVVVGLSAVWLGRELGGLW
jgi:CrcB protein